MILKGKTVCVCGIARSGVKTVAMLTRLGANIIITDIKDESKLEKEITQLRKYDAEIITGRNPDEEILSKCSLLVMSPGIPMDLPFVDIARKRSIPIWGELELGYRYCKAPIMAITGTNGKTTTTALIGEIMKSVYPKTQVLGNIGIPFTDKAMEIPEDSYGVLEVSSFQLESVDKFKPKAAAILQITPDHLDRHKTFENYVAIKKSIFKNQDEDDFLILNFDDPVLKEIEKMTKSRIFYFSGEAELEEGVFIKNGEIIARIDNVSQPVIDISEIPIPGKHNVENVMAAITMCISQGISISVIRDAIIKFKGEPHRTEFVTEKKGVAYYNDSKATNVDSAVSGLKAMSRPVILIGGGYDKHTDFSQWVKLFEGRVKHLIVMGEVAEQIMETCKAYSFTSVEKVNSLKQGVELAEARAEAGDCVLLSPACASWDMFDDYEQRGNLFKKFVKEL